MKKLSLVVCVLLPLLALAADDAARPDVDELLSVMRWDKTIQSSLDPMMGMLGGSGDDPDASPEKQAKMKEMADMVVAEMTGDKMKAQMVQIDSEAFSPEEVKSFIEFFKSPSGQVYLDKQPFVMKKSMEASESVMMELTGC